MDLPKLSALRNSADPIAILGLGLSGISSLKLLAYLGCKQLICFDQKLSDKQFQEILKQQNFTDTSCFNFVQSPSDLSKIKPKIAVVSPGLWLKTEWLQELVRQGTDLTSELELAFQVLDQERVIGITGSIGKSTTTTLLGLALEQQSSCFYGGNLGMPLADYALKKLKGQKKSDFVVLELSSYQLELFRNLACEVSIFTYLTPNHLDRYPDLQNYYETKWTLAEKTKSLVICNPEGGDLVSFVRKKEPHSTQVIWPREQNFPDFPFSNIKMLGAYQRQNMCLVLAACKALGRTSKIQQILTEFPGLPHRMENLGTHHQVHFVNDSKATTVPSVIEAFKAVQESLNFSKTHKVHLLVGGKDKNLNWETLGELKNFLATTALYFFGESRNLIPQKSGLKGKSYLTLFEATQAAIQKSAPGDTVLLSPGGTSHDEFSSFEDRGQKFKNYIDQIYQTTPAEDKKG